MMSFVFFTIKNVAKASGMESHLNHQIWGYAIFWQTQLWLKGIEPHWTQKWTVPCCQVFCQVGPSLGTEYVSSIFKLWILPAFCSRISISPTHFEIQTKDQTNSTQTAQKSMIPCFDPKKKVLLEPFCVPRPWWSWKPFKAEMDPLVWDNQSLQTNQILLQVTWKSWRKSPSVGAKNWDPPKLEPAVILGVVNGPEFESQCWKRLTFVWLYPTSTSTDTIYVGNYLPHVCDIWTIHPMVPPSLIPSS
jgi:hypothetical protein